MITFLRNILIFVDFHYFRYDDNGPFLFQDVQGFMLQLLEAIPYVHETKIAHLDIATSEYYSQKLIENP